MFRRFIFLTPNKSNCSMVSWAFISWYTSRRSFYIILRWILDLLTFASFLTFLWWSLIRSFCTSNSFIWVSAYCLFYLSTWYSIILSFYMLKYSLFLSSLTIFWWFFSSSILNSSSSLRNSLLIFSSLNLLICSMTLSLFSALLMSLWFENLSVIPPAVWDPALAETSID